MRPVEWTTVPRPIVLLAMVLLPVTTGCWPGRAMGPAEFEYVHPSVRWVYETGGQIGNKFVFIAPIRNIVLSLESGPGCVIVEEVPFGCMENGWWRPRYALDLVTGRLVTGQADGRDDGSIGSEYLDHQMLRVNLETQFFTPAGTRELYVGRPQAPPEDRTLLLRAKTGEDIQGFRELVAAEDEVVVISLGYRHVACIDLARLPASQPTALNRSE